MCSLSGLAIALGMSMSDCTELAQPGYDAATATTMSEIRLATGEPGYKITCNQETQLCIRRAEAICAGQYRLIDDSRRRPRVQAFVDGKIVTVNTDNPSSILVACAQRPARK